MKTAPHPRETEFAGVEGYLARPQAKPRNPKWRSRLIGSLTQRADGTWAKVPEAERGRGGIQETIESYLGLTGKTYFRLPDLLMFALSPRCDRLPIGWRKHLADYLKGWPDLLIPRILPGYPYPMLLALELKTLAGRQTKVQKAVGSHVQCRVAHSSREAIAIIDDFFAWKAPAPAMKEATP